QQGHLRRGQVVEVVPLQAQVEDEQVDHRGGDAAPEEEPGGQRPAVEVGHATQSGTGRPVAHVRSTGRAGAVVLAWKPRRQRGRRRRGPGGRRWPRTRTTSRPWWQAAPGSRTTRRTRPRRSRRRPATRVPRRTTRSTPTRPSPGRAASCTSCPATAYL